MNLLAAPRGATQAGLLAELQAWVQQGALRRLDLALAQLMAELDPDADATVLLGTALLAQVEGQGHACLPLDALLQDAQGLLAWGPEPLAQLGHVLDRLPGSVPGWRAALCRSPLVAHGRPAPGSAQPLVLAGQRLYLRRYWHFEQEVAQQVRQRVATAESVGLVAARQWLDLLFPAPAAPGPPGPAATDWQKTACAVALGARLSVITGGPGTGKTYTAARLLALLLAMAPAPERLRVALAAPTGKAAARLGQSIVEALQGLQAGLDAAGHALPLQQLLSQLGAATTLHALLGARPDTRRFAYNAARPLPLDVLIVDEASMVHLEMMAALLGALPPQARVVLLGDKDQLASVEAGAVLGDLCHGADLGHYRPETAARLQALTGRALPTRWLSPDGTALAQQVVMLRESRRFGGPIGTLALQVNAGQAEAAQRLLQAPPDTSLHWLADCQPAAVLQLALQGRAGAEGGYRSYLQCLAQRPADDGAFDAWVLAVLLAWERFRVLCAVREGEWGVQALNRAIERALVQAGLLTRRLEGGEWYVGRPVMVTRNDAGVGVFNGDIGIVLRPRAAAASASLRGYFLQGQGYRSVGVSRLAHVETAFAMTVHKSQGSEFEHTVLVLPAQPSRVLTRELVYTGITRARQAFTLVSGRRQALADAVGSVTWRASGLRDALDNAGTDAKADPGAQDP
jgi:exodeoxyribonuclease V alpha subunit